MYTTVRLFSCNFHLSSLLPANRVKRARVGAVCLWRRRECRVRVWVKDFRSKTVSGKKTRKIFLGKQWYRKRVMRPNRRRRWKKKRGKIRRNNTTHNDVMNERTTTVPIRRVLSGKGKTTRILWIQGNAVNGPRRNDDNNRTKVVRYFFFFAGRWFWETTARAVYTHRRGKGSFRSMIFT